MEAFVANITSFPTAIFTFLNVVVVGYWLFMMFGFLDIDCLDIEVDVDTDSGDAQGIAGFLIKLGLTGVPFTIVLSVLSIVSFAVSYYAVYFGLLFTAQSWLYVISGLAITLLSIVLSLPITAKLIIPLKSVFSRFDSQFCEKSLLGATCTIRTSKVDTKHGEAECTIDGASLIIKVRSDSTPFKHGDKAVIIEHDADSQVYHIVSQSEFNQ